MHVCALIIHARFVLELTPQMDVDAVRYWIGVVVETHDFALVIDDFDFFSGLTLVFKCLDERNREELRFHSVTVRIPLENGSIAVANGNRPELMDVFGKPQLPSTKRLFFGV